MEETVFYIAQALGIVTVILGFINYQVKSRGQILMVQMSTAACFAMHYVLLGAWTGAALNLLAVIRNLFLYFVGKKGKSIRPIAIVFAVIMGVVGVATSLIAQEKWYFVLFVWGIVINSVALSFKKPNNIRKSILISSPPVLAYNCCVRSLGGAIYEVITIISSIVGLIRYRDKTVEVSSEG